MLLILIVVPHSVVYGQEENETAEPLEFGVPVDGALGNSIPRVLYRFDGLRGEVLNITMRATSGSLDTVLLLLDSSGTVIATNDDSEGTSNSHIEGLRVQQSDTFTLIAGRFGFGLGSTNGGYTLMLERVGVSSASGSALRYGDSIINNITNMAPVLYYSFRAQRGDLINVQMQRISGDLDPVLQVVNSNAFVVAENDDVLGSPTLDAAISGLLIEQTGTYIIVATRFGQAAGMSSGNFVLTLDTAQNSGFGNSPQAAVPIQPGDVLDGELTERVFTRYYRFDAVQNDLVTVMMNRTSGSVDSFLAIADANLRELVTDDDGGGGQNSKIESYLIPADGTYYVVATRFERESGTTVGGYRLDFQSLGNAFDGVPEDVQRIAYGTTVTGRIDDAAPQLIYAFRGVEGDVLTVSMNRGDGDLDPVLSILNDTQRPLVSNDDGGGGQNARIDRYVIPQTGIYYIRATRYSGEEGNSATSGSFIVVLARRFD